MCMLVSVCVYYNILPYFADYVTVYVHTSLPVCVYVHTHTHTHILTLLLVVGGVYKSSDTIDNVVIICILWNVF